MSGCSDEETSFSDAADHREGGSDGDDDDSEIEKSEERSKTRRRRRMGGGFGKAVVHQFTKAKRQIRTIKSRKSLVSKSRLGNEGNVIIVDGGDCIERHSGRGSGCRFCFSRPKVLESPDESPASDPNDPNFTHAMLRALIDKNDFYCRECNPHLDY